MGTTECCPSPNGCAHYEHICDGFIAEGVTEIRKSSDDAVVAPGWIFSRHAHIRPAISLEMQGRPTVLRYFDPSNFRATSGRYQARIVPGLTMTVTSDRVDLCGSVNRKRFGNWDRRIRFPATRYSFAAAAFGLPAL